MELEGVSRNLFMQTAKEIGAELVKIELRILALSYNSSLFYFFKTGSH